MSCSKSKNLGLFAVGFTVFAFVAAQGCSNSDDTQASPPSAGSAGKAGGTVSEAGTGDVSEAGSGNDTSNGGSGNTGNEAGSGNVGNEAGAGAGAGGEGGGPASCTGPDGCYLCAPTTSAEFENGCVTGGCPDSFTDTLSKKSLVGTL
jgi:hypothetical protein